MNSQFTLSRRTTITAMLVLLSVAGYVQGAAGTKGSLVSPSFAIPFSVNENNRRSYQINFGVNPAATKAIDAALGEVEYPPFPPGGGMVMFRPSDYNCLLDLRAAVSPAQIDTFQVGIALLDDGIPGWDSLLFPMVLSWPDLSPYYSGSVRLKTDMTGVPIDIDMKAQNSYTLPLFPMPTLPMASFFSIIAEGPLPLTFTPLVSTFGFAGGGLQGLVNAPSAGAAASGAAMSASGTSTWFEYGPTRTYGSTTAPQTVPDGASMTVSAPFDPATLPMDSRMHFRAVAQTAGGTYYGADQILSNGNPPPEAPDPALSVLYRTALYRDWADAKDGKGKRLSVKQKNQSVAFDFRLLWPDMKYDGLPPSDSGITLKVKFSMPTSGTISGIRCVFPDLVPFDSLYSWANKKEFSVLLPRGKASNADCSTLPELHLRGIGGSGKAVTLQYQWSTSDVTTSKATLPGKPHFHVVDSVMAMTLLLPMPDLVNVGEGIYGGVKQTAVNITVGANDDPKGAHTAYHPKYKDVLKSLVKGKKGGDLYHTALPHWLNTFDKNNHPIDKKQKGIAPDQHNNILFAEQLALKLNVAASDSGIFPPGFGNLIYTHSTPFDGMTIRQIVAQVDSFLGRPPVAPEVVTDSSVYLKVVQDLNAAFAGPMDTVSWGTSGGKVICTGVKMLGDVPYLSPGSPEAAPIPFARSYDPAAGTLPEGYALFQNYPNPFNPTTMISFHLQTDALVTLKVYNTLGQEVATLLDHEQMDEGGQEVEFDASGLASGVYYYRIRAEGAGHEVFTSTRKTLLLR